MADFGSVFSKNIIDQRPQPGLFDFLFQQNYPGAGDIYGPLPPPSMNAHHPPPAAVDSGYKTAPGATHNMEAIRALLSRMQISNAFQNRVRKQP